MEELSPSAVLSEVLSVPLAESPDPESPFSADSEESADFVSVSDSPEAFGSVVPSVFEESTSVFSSSPATGVDSSCFVSLSFAVLSSPEGSTISGMVTSGVSPVVVSADTTLSGIVSIPGVSCGESFVFEVFPEPPSEYS